MRNHLAILFLLACGLLACATAFVHLSCIILGPQCFRAQMAPDIVVLSSIEGTWLAPLGTLFVSFIFLVCAAYAYSKAGLIRKLPFLNLGVRIIAIVCLIRGLLTFQLKFRHPELVDTLSFVVGSIWFLTGVMYWLGAKWKTRQEDLL